MIDIIALITALTPIVTGIVSAITSIVTYLKTKQIHQVVTQNNQLSKTATQSNNP